MEEQEIREHHDGLTWDDMEFEVTDLDSDHIDVTEVTIDHFELDFTTGSSSAASAKLVETHFPSHSNKITSPTVDDVDIGLLVRVIIFPLAAVSLAIIAARRCAPRRKQKSEAKERKSSTAVRTPDICTALKEVSQLPAEELVTLRTTGYYHCTALSQAFYQLVCNEHTQIESVLRDQSGDHSAQLSREDTLDIISRQVDAIVRVLERAVKDCQSAASTGKRGRRAHIEDRLDAHDRKVALSAVLMNYVCVRDALRETTVLSAQRHTQTTYARLRKAIETGDEYTMLLCIELLGGDIRYTSEIHEAQEKISELHEVQDMHVRTEEQHRFEREKQEMIETFQAFSLNGTPRESESGSLKQPHAVTNDAFSAPIAVEVPFSPDGRAAGVASEKDVPAPSAPPLDGFNRPTDVPDNTNPIGRENEGTVLLSDNTSTKMTTSGTLSPVDSAAALQIRSQWTMDALKMKRESAQAVQRRLQELRDRRTERRERAHREARAAVDVREREIQKAKITLSGLAEQKKARWREEDRSLQEAERALVAEFEREKEQQLRGDQRVYAAVAVVAAAMYLMVRSGFDVRQGGAYGLYQWALTVVRGSCDFLACESQRREGYSVILRTTATTRQAPALHAIVAPALLALPMPDAQQVQQLNRTAVQVVQTYQSTYRSTVQYASATVWDAVSRTALQAALGSWVASSAQTATGGTETTVMTELYAAGKCVLHVLARTVPSWGIAKLLKFIGLKGISGWAAAVLSLLCFSDVILQMALGPLLPLLAIGAAHAVFYAMLCNYTENVLRWRVGGWDVRGPVLHVLYPALLLLVVYVAAAWV